MHVNMRPFFKHRHASLIDDRVSKKERENDEEKKSRENRMNVAVVVSILM